MFSSLFQRKPALWLAVAAVATTAVVTAIVVISPRLASTPTLTTAPGPAAREFVADATLPEALADKLLAPPAGTAEAFDTPFFNATEEPLTLNGLKGRGLVVNFWATWCVPCVKEMPALDALAATLEGSGVDVIAISEDRGARIKVPKFYADKGIENLPLHYDEQGQLSRKLGVNGLPTTLLIDSGGREVGRVTGILEWDDDDLARFFQEHLSRPDQP